MKKINTADTSRALVKNTGIIAIGQMSTKLINFFLLPLYTALLSTEEYGLIDLLSTCSTVIVIFVGMQINLGIFRFLAACRGEIEKTKGLISTSIVMVAGAIVAYSLMFCFISEYITLEHKWYLVAHVAVSVYLQVVSGIARGLGDNTAYAIGNFFSASISLVLNVIFIAGMRLGIESMLVAYVIGPFLGGTFILFRCKLYKYFSTKMVNLAELKTILNYSLPLIPNELSWGIIHYSDRIIVSSVLSIAVNGIIAVASKFSAIYTTVFSIFNTSWTEQVVLHYKDEGGPEYINQMFDKVVTLFATLAIGIITCMPFVFDLFVDNQFAEAYQYIPVYMIAVFFNAIIGMISSIYLVNNETKQVAMSTMLSAGINLVVNLGLINWIGVFAAPVSSICAYASVSAWRLFDVNRRHCRICMPMKKIICLVVCLVFALAGYYGKNIIIQVLALLVVLIVAFGVNRDMLNDIIMFVQTKRKQV